MREITRDIVGGVIISRDKKVLLGRNVQGGIHDDQWVIPGGGVEDGEDRNVAFAREMKEEIGIDIGSARVVPFDSVFSGTAEKTLRDTNERVSVRMTFYDSVVYLQDNAADVQLVFEDDFETARFFERSELGGLAIAPFTARRLEELGYLTQGI